MTAEKPLVIALNGPPGVGKDALADSLMKYMSDCFTRLSIKEPLLEMAYKDPDYGHVIAHVWAPGADHSLKDTPVILANGLSMTPRDMIITVATRLRQQHGDNYFAKKAAEKIGKMAISEKAILITDVGFDCELSELEKNCDVLLVHMTRTGCSFANDSRNYLTHPNTIFLSNNSSVSALQEQFLISLEEKLREFYNKVQGQ